MEPVRSGELADRFGREPVKSRRGLVKIPERASEIGRR